MMFSRNRFELAHYHGRGGASQRQVNALDRFLTTMGSDRFDVYRARVGIAPDTPNRSLSKQVAWMLLQEITRDLEATR